MGLFFFLKYYSRKHNPGSSQHPLIAALPLLLTLICLWGGGRLAVVLGYRISKAALSTFPPAVGQTPHVAAPLWLRPRENSMIWLC